jgi:hypothetical protein
MADRPAIILIKGKLPADGLGENLWEFAAIAAKQPNAIVFLNGPGGSLETGLAIGTLDHLGPSDCSPPPTHTHLAWVTQFAAPVSMSAGIPTGVRMDI